MAGSRKSSGPVTGETAEVEDAVIVPETPQDPRQNPVLIEEPMQTDEPLRIDESRPMPEPMSEPEPAPQARPLPSDTPPPAPALPPKRGGFLPLALGGVVAAGLGFGLAQYVPDGWPIGSDPVQFEALQTALAEQATRSDQLAADLAAMREDMPQGIDPQLIIDLTGRIDSIQTALADQQPSLDARLATLTDGLAALDGRVNVLERRPVGGGAASDTALSAYEEQLSALRAMVEAQQAQSSSVGDDIAAIAADAKAQLAATEQRAAELQTQAEASARSATARAALLRVQAALEAGGGFGGALDDMEASGVPIPEILRAQAAGVPSLQDLQRDFAEPARAALDASLKATVGDGTMDRVGAFLRSQLGARSLEPQAGDDPDAILSRAEAALQAGDLPASLTEIAALPEPGQAQLADWVTQAQARLTTQAAIDALAATLDK